MEVKIVAPTDTAVPVGLPEWGQPVSYYSKRLALTIDYPENWKLEEATQPAHLHQVRFLAPAHGQPPFQAEIVVFYVPSPPALSEQLESYVRTKIFEVNSQSDKPGFKAKEVMSCMFGPIPAFLQNSSWTHYAGIAPLEIRQQLLVMCVPSGLYVYRVIMNAELSDPIYQVFTMMRKSANYHYDDGKPEETATAPNKAVSSSNQSSELQPRHFPDGVWHKRK